MVFLSAGESHNFTLALALEICALEFIGSFKFNCGSQLISREKQHPTIKDKTQPRLKRWEITNHHQFPCILNKFHL